MGSHSVRLSLRVPLLWLLPACVLAGAALLLGGRMLGGSAGRATAAWISFHDRAAGLSIDYPAGWRRLSTRDSGVRLLAARAGGALLLRVSLLPFDAAADPIRAARQLALAALSGDPQARPLAGGAARVGSLPGYVLTYLFADPRTRRPAVHVEYFLPHGRQLITLVLQSSTSPVPRRLSKVFSQVVASLRSRSSVSRRTTGQ